MRALRSRRFKSSKNVRAIAKPSVIAAQFSAWPMPVCPLLEDEGRVMQQSLAIGQYLAQKYGSMSSLRCNAFIMFFLGLLGDNVWQMGKICEIAHNYEDQIQAVVKEGLIRLIITGGTEEEKVSLSQSVE